MITNWFDKTFTVKRNEWVQDSEGRALDTAQVELDSIEGNIQQASAEYAEAMDLEFRKTFVLYTSFDADIEEGDILSYDGDEYTVAGVQRFYHEKVGNPHTRAIIHL